jgi:hypothetical protein
LLHQLVERQTEETIALLVDQHLARVAEHRLHHVEVQPVARHTRRLGVFGQDGTEAGGVALGLLRHLGVVAVGLFHEARGEPAGARHDVVGVGLALVDEAHPVLLRLHRVVERRLHLLRRLHALQRHLLDVDARLVAVHRLLHEVARLGGDVLAALVQREVHLGAADDLADRRLGHELHHLLGLAVVEDEGFRAHEVVLHRELDVDDVLVLGQHHRFLGVAVRRGVAIADLDGAHLLEIDDVDRFDREGQVPARPGLRGLRVLAEAGHDAAPAFVDDIEAAREPDEEHERDDEAGAADGEAAPRGTAAGVAAVTAPEQVAHAAIDVAPDLVEVGRTAAIVAVPALAPLGIVERHRLRQTRVATRRKWGRPPKRATVHSS